MVSASALVVLLLATAGAAQAAPGELDSTFGAGGIVTIPEGVEAAAVALQPDGKIVAAGGRPGFVIARYNSNGSLDSSFASEGVATISSFNRANALALQPNGKIVAVGSSYNGSQWVFALARFNPSGLLDPDFGSDGKVTTAIGSSALVEARAVALQPNGKIVAGGYSDAGDSVFTLVRYQADGSLDTDFGTGGIVTTPSFFGSANGVAVQSDGKIVAAGWSSLARYQADGSLDAGFGVDGVATTPGADFNAVALQPDGKIVAAGRPRGGAYGLARYNPDGSPDAGFGTGGLVTTDLGGGEGALAVALQGDGKIVTAGHQWPGETLPNDNFAVVRYEGDGALDTGFGICGKTVTVTPTMDIARGLALQPDGKIVAAGSTEDASSRAFEVARYLDGGEGSGDCRILSIDRLGQGTGVVYSAPQGVRCDPTCSAPFPAGSSVTLAADPDTRSVFSGWGGDCSGADTCTLTLDQARSVTATFSICVVPKLKGKRLERAKQAIVAAHCSVGRVTRRLSRRVEKGSVVWQRPPARSRRPAGTKVDLVVSKGKRGRSARRHRAKRVRVVLTTAGTIAELAAGGSRIAWLQYDDSSIHGYSFSTHRKTRLARAGSANYPDVGGLTVAGARIYWREGFASNSEFGWRLRTATRLRSTMLAHGRYECGSGGTGLGGVAGSGSIFLYSTYKLAGEDCEAAGDYSTVTASRLFRVTASQRRLRTRGVPKAPGTTRLAYTGGRVASVPLVNGVELADQHLSKTVEVRDARSGALVRRFETSAYVWALALSSRRVIVLVAERGGTDWRIERYSVRTGARLGTTPVPPPAHGASLDVAGSRVVYGGRRAGRQTILLVRADTGRTKVLYRGPAREIQIAGRRVVWVDGRDQIKEITLGKPNA